MGIVRYVTGVYLQVNALSEWIIGIYPHEFTNNEREISIPHEVATIQRDQSTRRGLATKRW